MKPNEVVKMRPQPLRASRSITRSESGPSCTLSTIAGFDLVAERLLHVEPANIVLLAEAAVIVRAGIDPARLQLGRLGAA